MQTLGADYLHQQAYDRGDPLACCGCPLVYGQHAKTCDCRCHEIHTFIWKHGHLDPAV